MSIGDHKSRRSGCLLFTATVAALAVTLVPNPAGAQRVRRADDKAAPVVRIVAPANAERVENFTPSIDVVYGDEGSGVSVVTFRAMVNDRDYSADFEHHSQGATAKIARSHPLPLGENRIMVTVADRLGNVGRAESTFINAGGGWLTVVAGPGVGPRRHVELVLDASGSMNDALLDNTRIGVAKSAVKSLVRALPDETPLGLRVFRGCDSITALLPIAKVDKPAFTAAVDKIEPAGGTPIVASLLESFAALAKFPAVERVAVLVTDGGESCAGSMADAAEQAKELSIRVIVISFDIKEQTITEQLQKLAEMTGGAYFNAQDGAELQAALERSVLRLGYTVVDAQSRQAGQGEVNGERLMLPIGTYQVRFDLSSSKLAQNVTIGPLGDVTVRLRQAGAGVTAELVALK